MRTMWDGVTAKNLPTNAEIVAGYVEGRYTWSQADWNRFPNSIKVTIAIWSSDADVLDIETGDATPAMGPDWVRRQRARGAFPTVYCNRSTWPAVQSALAGAGFVNGQHYDLWLADYTQQPHCPAYAAACQYADPGPYDLSLCQDYWPRSSAAPPPPAIPRGGGMIAYDPINPSDVYQVAIGTNGRFYARKGWDQALADSNWIDVSGSAAPAFAPQSAAIAIKADGAFYALEALGTDGTVWSCVRAASGAVVQDWKSNLGTASLPSSGSSGAQGPPGPSYDDGELRGELQKLKDRVAAVARALS